MAIKAEQLAAESLADWLRLKLPAKVAEVNATRAAVLKAPIAGPYTLPETPTYLEASKASREAYSTIDIGDTGSTATSALVTTINAGGLGSIATADTADRLVLTATAAPVEGTPSVVAIGPEVTAGANAAFGWARGGEHVVRVALPVPTWKEVRDGWPVRPDFSAGFWVVIGDRASVPVFPPQRRDEYLVTLDVAVFVAPKQQEIHGDREIIEAAVRCVRECLVTDEGRKLGGTVLYTAEKSCKISGRPWKLVAGKDTLNPLFEMATLMLEVRVFERQPAS